MEIFFEKLTQIPDLAIGFVPKILFAVLIVVVGKFVLDKVLHSAEDAVVKIPNIDQTLASFFTSTIYFSGMSLVFVAALSALSIPMGFLATMMGALVLALGFALQGALGDLASGILLIVFRPYNVGDEVELNGTEGVVTHLALFATRLKTRENVQITIANGNAFGNTIKNHYAFGTRRLDMDFGVSYDADLDCAIEALLSVCEGDVRILADPAPWAKVVSLGDSSVDLQLRVWCQADDHRKIEVDLPYRVKNALDKAGVEIPYPHATIIKQKAG